MNRTRVELSRRPNAAVLAMTGAIVSIVALLFAVVYANRGFDVAGNIEHSLLATGVVAAIAAVLSASVGPLRSLSGIFLIVVAGFIAVAASLWGRVGDASADAHTSWWAAVAAILFGIGVLVTLVIAAREPQGVFPAATVVGAGVVTAAVGSGWGRTRRLAEFTRGRSGWTETALATEWWVVGLGGALVAFGVAVLLQRRRTGDPRSRSPWPMASAAFGGVLYLTWLSTRLHSSVRVSEWLG